jgi:hypothetical protein
MIQRLFITGLILSMMSACINPPDYSVIPEIAIDSLSKTYVKGFSSNPPVMDSITFYISFTDGNGDLGPVNNDTTPNLLFKDSRTGFINGFQFPFITPEGNVKDISGYIAYTFSPFDCIPGNTIDTFYYTISIVDRAGNFSNEVTTPNIICDCN